MRARVGKYAVRVLDYSEWNPDSDWGLIISKQPHANPEPVSLELQ